MRKRIGLTVAVGLVASVASVQAAACLDDTTVAALVALGSTGCTVGDKLFNNFTYAQNNIFAPGAGALSADLLDVGTQSFGWDIALASGANIIGNFTFGYNVSVIGSPNLISSTESQMFAATQPGPGVTMNQLANITFTAGTPLSVSLDNRSNAGLTAETVIDPGVTMLGVNAVATTGVTAGIRSLQTEVFQTVIPEPVTLVLTGAGLLGLGLLRRLRRT